MTQRKSILTLANKITIVRILIIPGIVIGLLDNQTVLVFILVGVSMVTDLLDGLAARMRGERTQLGAFLDPMADKLLLTAVYLTLTYLNKLQTWVFVVIFSRDLLIVLGWNVIHILTGSSQISPRLLGKITTAVQMATALILILNLPFEIKRWFIYATVSCTIISAADYVMSGEKKLTEWS